MKTMSKFLVVLAVGILAFSCYTLDGQSKKEVKQYKKALKSGTVESFEAFLAKFPNSVLSEKVVHLIDSIHFSAVNTDDISSCAAFLSQYPSSEYYDMLDGKIKEMAMNQRYIQDNSLSSVRIVKEFENYEFSGKNYYFYIFENVAPEVSEDLKPGDKCEYVVNLLDKTNGAIHSSMFSGKVIAADNGMGYMIEGDYMDEGNAGGYILPEAIHLLALLKDTDFLLPISEGDVMTDQALDWWFKNNPAKTKRLKFGLLPEESSIVQMFKGSKEFESKGGYKVAQFDIRGYTVIAAYQSSSNQYMLVWAEPICKDKKKDPLLNTIYFENNTSLVLYYYHGRTTYKVRINMANKTLAR